MGATKESPATQVLTWAVGKLDEASKIDWVEKLNTLTASRPAYLRSGVLTAAAPSRPAPGPAAGGGVSEAELDTALRRAAQAEARADDLARRVAKLEAQLAATNSHSEPSEVTVPDVEDGEHAEGDEHHKSHWWSRHH